MRKIKMRDGSGSRYYKYVREQMDRYGNVRVYFLRRRGDKKIRMHAKPGTPEFEREHSLLLLGAVPTVTAASSILTYNRSRPESLRWLCEKYFSSTAFLKLDKHSTRLVRRRVLEQICQTRSITGVLAGDLPFQLLDAAAVAAIRDVKRDKPEAATTRVKTLRALYKWAISKEAGPLATHNPARDVEYVASNNPDGHRAWDEELLQRYDNRHALGTKARLVSDFLNYIGCRISDLVRFSPAMAKDSVLHWTEYKNRNRKVKRHATRILPPLAASIEAYLRDNPPARQEGRVVDLSAPYLATKRGKAYTIKGLGNYFARQCRLAGIPTGYSAHGRRKAAAIRCALAGATLDELKAVFGWATAKEAVRYTEQADRNRLELRAQHKMLRPQDRESVDTTKFQH